MALKLNLTQAEFDALGADDATKATQLLYKKVGTGFVLDVSDLPDYAGLQGLLNTANNEAATRKRELAALQNALGGKKPEEITEALARLAEAETNELEKKGQWDQLREQMNTRHAEAIKGWETKVNTSNELVGRLKKKLADTGIENEATSAIAQHKGSPELLLHVVKGFVRPVESEDGLSFTHQVVDEKGTPRVDGKGAPLTIAALVEELRQSEKYARAFDGTGNTGSGKNNKQGNNNKVARPEGLPETYAECKTVEQKTAWMKHKRAQEEAAKAAAA